MKDTTSNISDSLTATTIASGIAHFATLYQPIVSFLCGVVGIVSGIMAIRHYYLKSNQYGNKDKES